MPNPLHSSSSPERYTPAEYVELVRYTFGGPIELDVASCRTANRVVRAKRFYTAARDGLSKRWAAGNVYCNAPGEERGKRTMAFWAKLTGHWLAGDIGTGIWAGFNLGQLSSLQGHGAPGPQRFPIAFPSSRICWLDEDLEPLPQPGHGNFFVLLTDDLGTWCRFREAFSTVGEVMRPDNPLRRA